MSIQSSQRWTFKNLNELLAFLQQAEQAERSIWMEGQMDASQT
jgi:hypothetical protein